MRKLMLVPVMVSVAGALGAQTPVKVSAQSKEVRAQAVPIKSVEDLRALKGQIDELKVRNLQNDSLWRIEIEKKGDPRRMQMLLDEMERNFWPLFTKQSQLALACAELRGPFAGWIGVAFEREAQWTKDPRTDRITMNFFGRPRVAEIEAGSPAAQAGVQSGDEWLALNGRLIDDSVEFNELDKPGVSVSIRTARVGKLMDVVVVMGKRPFPEDVCEVPKPELVFSPMVKTPAAPRAGVREGMTIIRVPGGMPSRLFLTGGQFNFGGAVLRVLDDDQRERLKFRGDGVLVSEVGRATPASAAGIKSLDIVVIVNDAPVASLVDVARAIGRQPAMVTMTLQREGKEILVKLPAR
ncbi:MAG TPA: PDZ domain-containing protein [Gemmatimonadaceae bacterium]|nr:PDZ domain-containing protein [Gemmatimonadaceae bacterium]